MKERIMQYITQCLCGANETVEQSPFSKGVAIAVNPPVYVSAIGADAVLGCIRKIRNCRGIEQERKEIKISYLRGEIDREERRDRLLLNRVKYDRCTCGTIRELEESTWV